MNRAVKVLGSFLKSRLTGGGTPLIASFKVTYRCNLSCMACPFHLLGDQNQMDWDTAVKSLDLLASMGCPVVVFEGGEPLLWADGARGFKDLAVYAKRLFPCVAVTTNGTMNLDVPTDICWVSVDGSRETHNRLRSGSYDTLMENLGRTTHPKVFVHTTFNSLNYQECTDIAQAAFAIPAVRGMTVQLFYPYGKGEEPLALSRLERRVVLEKVMALKKLGYPILNSYWGLMSMIDNSWECRDKLLANVNPDGSIHLGCYVKGRTDVVCSECGFTPVAEASGAYALKPGAILAGMRIFLGS